MASPDESRADDARDPSSAPESPEASLDAESDGGLRTGAVAPGRPRGAASFPGGPPPVSAPPPEEPAPPPAPVAVQSPPRFQVTTVESTAAASFPGGPPPVSTPPGNRRLLGRRGSGPLWATSPARAVRAGTGAPPGAAGPRALQASRPRAL